VREGVHHESTEHGSIDEYLMVVCNFRWSFPQLADGELWSPTAIVRYGGTANLNERKDDSKKCAERDKWKERTLQLSKSN
jgi:hypothetical protein